MRYELFLPVSCHEVMTKSSLGRSFQVRTLSSTASQWERKKIDQVFLLLTPNVDESWPFSLTEAGYSPFSRTRAFESHELTSLVTIRVSIIYYSFDLFHTILSTSVLVLPILMVYFACMG